MDGQLGGSLGCRPRPFPFLLPVSELTTFFCRTLILLPITPDPAPPTGYSRSEGAAAAVLDADAGVKTGAVAVREKVEGGAGAGVEGVFFSSTPKETGSTAAASFLAFLRADLEIVGGSVGGIEVIVGGVWRGECLKREGGR